MSTQSNLFFNDLDAGIQKALSAPICATADPETSHLAAKQVTESGRRKVQLERVLNLVKRYPLCTSAELAKFGKEDRHLVARRLPELTEGHLVSRRTPRLCTVGNRLATTWEAN